MTYTLSTYITSYHFNFRRALRHIILTLEKVTYATYTAYALITSYHFNFRKSDLRDLHDLCAHDVISF